MGNLAYNQGMEQEIKGPTILGGNIVYLVILLLVVGSSLLLTGSAINDPGSTGYYLINIIVQVFIIAGPPFIYMKAGGMNIKQVIRFNRAGGVELLLIVVMAVFGFGVITGLNMIWYWVVSHWGTPLSQRLPPINNMGQFAAAVLVICVIPAIVEEFFFRGLILRSYEGMGRAASIIITGVLFGFLHCQLMAIPGAIILGICISYVVYRTNSIFSGVLFHFIYNFIVVSLLYLQNLISPIAAGLETGTEEIFNAPPEIMMAAFVIWGMMVLGSLVLFTVCIVQFHRRTGGVERAAGPVEVKRRYPTVVEMIPAMLALLIVTYALIKEVLYMIEMG